jgi:flagellar hook protein FlgE
MRLESALYASREGLQAHGQAITVVGDNISNSNTVGYKAARTEFSDLFSEGDDGARTTSVNGAGNGVAVSTVRPIFNNGTLDFTGRQLDFGIEGNGFFVFGDAQDPRFGRAGNFTLSPEGFLVNAAGEQVLGFGPGGAALGPINLRDFEFGGGATTAATVVGNLSSETPVGGEVPANPATFQEVNAGAAFSNSVEVFDSLGASQNISLYYYKTDVNSWTVAAFTDGAAVGGEAGVPVSIGEPLELQFGEDGALLEGSATELTLTPQWSNGAAAGNFTVSMAGFSQFAGSNTVSSITQNGQGVGEILGYEVTQGGVLRANLSSGANIELATLALATFTNNDGLDRIGGGMFVGSERSGAANIAAAGTGAQGAVRGAALELSTVDIASEFTSMVVYQRGYQANSTTFSTTTDIIRDTIGMLR